MTNQEIMIADAEYWAGTMSAGELMDLYRSTFADGAIARITFLCTEYGKNRNADDEYETAGNEDVTACEQLSWFSLLIGEAESSIIEGMQEGGGWPFPVVHGAIPA